MRTPADGLAGRAEPASLRDTAPSLGCLSTSPKTRHATDEIPEAFERTCCHRPMPVRGRAVRDGVPRVLGLARSQPRQPACVWRRVREPLVPLKGYPGVFWKRSKKKVACRKRLVTEAIERGRDETTSAACGYRRSGAAGSDQVVALFAGVPNASVLNLTLGTCF
jgi:hypothetical protein